MVSGRNENAPQQVRRRMAVYGRKRIINGDRVFNFFNYLFLILFTISVFYPFWRTLLESFATFEESSSLGFKVWLKEWTLDSYKFAFGQYGNVGVAYRNSILRTAIGTVLGVFVTLLGAYAISKKNLPGRTLMVIYILIPMFFSGGLIPTYLLIRAVGLIDSFWVYIFPGLVGVFNIIIVRNFLMTIDKAYEESALIDGANQLQILIRIIMPLSKAVLAVVALWIAVGQWNSWFDAVLYIKRESLIVLQLLLRRLLRDADVMRKALYRHELDYKRRLPSYSAKCAVVMLTIGPIILLYPFLQRYFVKGILIGSLKG